MATPVQRIHDRLRDIEKQSNGAIAISIKVRVTGGCFHRDHSPEAYAIMDEYRRTHHADAIRFEEHESGPELLVLAAMTAQLAYETAAIGLVKSVIDLVVTILKARTEGVNRGDNPREPLEVIVRRTDDARGITDETVIRIGNTDRVDRQQIQQVLVESTSRLLAKGDAPTKPQKIIARKKTSGRKAK